MAQRGKSPTIPYNQPFIHGTTEQILPSRYFQTTNNIIWRWGGDIASFPNTPIAITANGNNYNDGDEDAAGYGGRFKISSYTTSLQNTGGVGTRARFSITWASAQSGGCILSPIYNGTSMLQVPERFLLRYRVSMANNLKIGFMIHNNGTVGNPLLSYTTPVPYSIPASAGTLAAFGGAQLPSGNTWEHNRIEPSTASLTEYPFNSPGTTTAGSNPNNTTAPATGSVFEDEVMFDLATVSTPPYPLWYHHTLGGPLSTATNRADPSNLLGASPAASWTNQQGLFYLGVLLISNRTTGTSASVDLSEIVIKKHPMDEQ